MSYPQTPGQLFTQTPLASSADYADALLTARKAKGFLTLILFLVLLLELSLFFCMRYYQPMKNPTTPAQSRVMDALQYVVGLMDFVGLIAPAMLAVIIYLILQVQFVGRLLGTSRMVTGFLWSVLLALLLFPWQAVLNNPSIKSDTISSSLGMKVPGVIYTWAEVSNPSFGANFISDPKSDPPGLILHWSRFVAFPVLSMLILAFIHFKTHRGLRQSLGEDRTIVETTPAV